jgi:hypothetical protein
MTKFVVPEVKTVFWCFSLCHHTGYNMQAWRVRLVRMTNFEGRTWSLQSSELILQASRLLQVMYLLIEPKI